MKYDGMGRRIVKAITNSVYLDGTFHSYYSGQQEIESHNGFGFTIKQQTWGLGYVDELLLNSLNSMPMPGRSICDNAYYVLQDANYNVLGITDSTGKLVERYEYSPYGKRFVFYSPGDNDEGSYAPLSMSQRVQVQYYGIPSQTQPFGLMNFGHQGLHHDEEISLVYNRARMLHPTLGRFMQQDPIGYADSMSLYQYVGSNPVNYLDSAGLKLIRTEKPVSIAIGFGYGTVQGQLKGTLFRSLHCCEGNKNAGQQRYVSEIKVSGSYADSQAYGLSNLPGWAGRIGWVLEKVFNQKAEVGLKWKVSGSLHARYDGCEEKMMMANGMLSASAAPYGAIDLGGTINPYEKIRPIVGDLWGTVEWPNKQVGASLTGSLEGNATATGNAKYEGKTVILYGGLTVSGKINGRYTLWDWKVNEGFSATSGEFPVIENQEFARYTFE